MAAHQGVGMFPAEIIEEAKEIANGERS